MLAKFRPKFTIIDRYVFSETMAPLIGAGVFFAFILLVLQMIRLANLFIVKGINFSTLLEIFGLMMLSFLPFVIPIAFLISVSTAFSRLSMDSELTAMKASGISLRRITLPVVGIALALTVISSLFYIEIVPWGEKRLQTIMSKAMNTSVTSALEQGTFTSGFFGVLIYADQIDRKTGVLSRVFIVDERKPEVPMTIVAKNGIVLPVETGTEFGAAVLLRLENGEIHLPRRANSENYQKIKFGRHEMYLEILEQRASGTGRPKMWSLAEILGRMFPPEGEKPRLQKRAATELWRRIALAQAPIWFILLGVGFGTARARSARSRNILFTVFVGAAYWTLYIYFMKQANLGVIPAYVAMNLPNLIFFFIGAWAFRRAEW